MNIKLSHFVSGATTGVRNVDGNLGARTGANRLRLYANVLEAELCIAQAEAERKNRFAAIKQVAAIARRLVIVESPGL